MKKDKKRLIITDSNSIIHRSFHALPPLKNKDGELVNAAYGFLAIFLKTIKDFEPDYIATCFDLPESTFRHKEYEEYKSQRPPTPKKLYQQIPVVKKLLKLLNVPIFEKKGFEADDLIGTISKKVKKSDLNVETIILSGDLDILQLVDQDTKVYLSKSGKNNVLYNKEKVKEKYLGLKPKQLDDFRALRGDPSDNIPGISGIGQKTAIKLLNKFDNIENIYKELESKKDIDITKRNQKLLKKDKEKAFLSQFLAEIKRDVPIKIDYKKMEWGNYDREKVFKFLQELGFKTLIKRFKKIEEKNSLLKLL